MNANTLTPGDKVRTRQHGKRWWTVQASGSRYAICTRQAAFRPAGEYEYTILDFEAQEQGPCNLIGNGWDVSMYVTPEAGWRGLHVQLLSGSIELSRSQSITLHITETKTGDNR
ncbi:hypothetical protein [Paenarthrobacter nitroguajacolicus]|uniref:hypothetical protein n=1 Tax=Paenarthrobacter nitroguajacolicus TaxID=211146 RepID=UPI0015BA63AB|nr:hypothetical protein [Paenarthrobacter nitroguajacolicus]NWL34449.1 hypothetical protein [Paenarthrobacter nitroguajacolicus]